MSFPHDFRIAPSYVFNASILLQKFMGALRAWVAHPLAEDVGVLRIPTNAINLAIGENKIMH